VADYQVQGTDSSVWMPVFVRDCFAEDDALLRFSSKLSETSLDDSTTDKVRSKLNTKGCFTVRSFYLKLVNLNLLALEILRVRGFPSSLFGGHWCLSRFRSSFGKLHMERF